MERKRTVLLLENDTDLVSIIQYILEEECYSVIVSRPHTYLKDICEFQPDIIILDHWLCLTLGKNICKDLKANSETSSIPLILTSTFKDLFALGQNCIPDDFLSKPFDIEELAWKVNHLIAVQENTSKMSI